MPLTYVLKVGVVGRIKFEDRIRELVADRSLVAAIVTPCVYRKPYPS
jgi:hypothetical protein